MGRRAEHPPCCLGLSARGSSSLLCPEGLSPPAASSGSRGCSPLLADAVSLLVPRYNSAKKDNDFIYHEAVPALDTLQSVKGGDGLSRTVNPRGIFRDLPGMTVSSQRLCLGNRFPAEVSLVCAAHSPPRCPAGESSPCQPHGSSRHRPRYLCQTGAHGSPRGLVPVQVGPGRARLWPEQGSHGAQEEPEPWHSLSVSRRGPNPSCPRVWLLSGLSPNRCPKDPGLAEAPADSCQAGRRRFPHSPCSTEGFVVFVFFFPPPPQRGEGQVVEGRDGKDRSQE